MTTARTTGCLAVVAATLACTQDFDALRGDTAASSTASSAGSGGAPGSGGDGGAGGFAAGGSKGGAGGGGGKLPACPSGAPLLGAPMVAVPASKPYCIDVREVSNADYSDFLEQNNTLAPELPECTWNTNAKPQALMAGCTGGIPMHPFPHPVVCVDWCDAWEYCKWAGKRLCGRVGGPAGAGTPYDSPADAEQSEWFRACSRAGTQDFPYGDQYQSGSCNDASSDVGATAPTASFATCVGGFDGLFDMSGNVKEWENSCEASATGDDHCHYRSGSFESPQPEARCQTAADAAREAAFHDVGFRCCLDL